MILRAARKRKAKGAGPIEQPPANRPIEPRQQGIGPHATWQQGDKTTKFGVGGRGAAHRIERRDSRPGGIGKCPIMILSARQVQAEGVTDGDGL
jgi:hypothetical protein